MSPLAASGRDPDGVTLDAVRDGSANMADLSIHPKTLAHQADVAQAHANPELAANFRRAAELTAFSDEEVLGLYDALRPHRATAEELLGHADELESRGAAGCAALFREAAQVYARRGLLRR